MATATITEAVVIKRTTEKVITLTLTEDEAIGLKTLLNFAHTPEGVEGAENQHRVNCAIENVFAALAGIPCSYRKE